MNSAEACNLVCLQMSTRSPCLEHSLDAFRLAPLAVKVMGLYVDCKSSWKPHIKRVF